MVSRVRALKKASSVTTKHTQWIRASSSAAIAPSKPTLSSIFRVGSPNASVSQEELKHHYASFLQQELKQKDQERDFLVSVLESSSATKRDAKTYLQTFGSTLTQPKSKLAGSEKLRIGVTAINESPLFVQGEERANAASSIVADLPHVAVIQLRGLRHYDDEILKGVAKTLAQLRALGLLSVIVVDCDESMTSRQAVEEGYNRFASAIDAFGQPWTKIVDCGLQVNAESHRSEKPKGLDFGNRLSVTQGARITDALAKGSAVIISAWATSEDDKSVLANSDDTTLSVIRHLSGLQQSAATPFGAADEADAIAAAAQAASRKAAEIDRVVILDPIGGIPSKERDNNAHIFLNLEAEYDSTIHHLGQIRSALAHNGFEAERLSDLASGAFDERHTESMKLIRSALAMLPATSAGLITTPKEAANLGGHAVQPDPSRSGSVLGLLGAVGTVGTRKSHNPLIHNLLTGRPSYSSSLPIGRIKPLKANVGNVLPTVIALEDPVLRRPDSQMSPTTLVKRGMPVSIFPDPKTHPWTPPNPRSSEPRLKLTDPRIDLPRLVHLINDSFGRPLDVGAYLKRVEDTLAGLIVAGEYEGCAILTWETPAASERGQHSPRPVPYLDKFAVLRNSQGGAGGVADILFNAMVHDCFPGGVCWRSRRDNPVNKWYFERSRGTWKTLSGTEWSMFWTTPDLGVFAADGPKASSWEEVGQKAAVARLRDYEHVCRSVVPTWADRKQFVE